MSDHPASTAKRPARRLAAALATVVLVAGCADPQSNDSQFVHDPWEPVNRDFHSFNKGMDTVLLRPTAKVYDTVTPALARLLIRNGLSMLELPGIFVNHVLQGDIESAAMTAGRFGVNVVMGAGLIDPATELGLPLVDTDLGLTFAEWGVEEGPYVEMPLLGPATSRDAVGRIGQIALDPVNFVTGADVVDVIQPASTVLGAVEARAWNMSAIDQLLYQSADSYVATRSAYLQLRRREVAGGVTEEQLPDVFAD